MSSLPAQPEDRAFLAADRPKPSLFPPVAPPRLVRKNHGFRDHRLGNLLVSSFEGVGGLLAESLDAAHGKAQPERSPQYGPQYPPGESVAAAEHCDEGRQPGTEMPSPDAHRKLGALGLAAVFAAAPAQLVLDHHRPDGRDIRDLMADGLADYALVAVEVGVAMPTGAGQMRDDTVRVINHGPVSPLCPG